MFYQFCYLIAKLKSFDLQQINGMNSASLADNDAIDIITMLKKIILRFMRMCIYVIIKEEKTKCFYDLFRPNSYLIKF